MKSGGLFFLIKVFCNNFVVEYNIICILDVYSLTPAFDIRRWKIADQVGNGNVYGVKIEKQGAGFNYTTIVVDKLKFISPKMYLYGIPLNEILADPALVQNAGY